MTSNEQTRHSKFLSLVLRHKPETIGILLDDAGWVDVHTLLDALAANGHALSRENLDELVRTSPKQRFAFSSDGSRIRANQGHSVDVSLGLEPIAPPEILYHGTVAAALPAILNEGLTRQQRHHVHLSGDIETARIVGARRGKPVVLEVAAGRMHGAGHSFYCSENGVWLTDTVPPAFLRESSGDETHL